MREVTTFNKSTDKPNRVEEVSSQPSEGVFHNKKEGVKARAKKDISHYQQHNRFDDLYKKNLATKLRSYTHYVY